VTPSSATPPLDYDRLRDALTEAGVVVALAELHGGVCGAVCAGAAEAARRWLVDLLEDEQLLELPAGLADDLEEIVRTSVKMLDDGELAFEPLLPSDDAPLAEQVGALAAWCQGFLNGIGSSSPEIARRSMENDSFGEILRDFTQISRAGLSEEEAEGHGQPDFALAEIHEYVRVSVQIVFEGLGPQRAAAGRDVH